MMCRCHKQIFDVIIIYGIHTFDSSSTAILALEVVDTHSLDVTKVCHGYYGIF